MRSTECPSLFQILSYVFIPIAYLRLSISPAIFILKLPIHCGIARNLTSIRPTCSFLKSVTIE